ncbi:MAG: hypothetical protein P1V97_39565, partial [Planctomycetota bacterium]|nr:hypothetical protein [Planctomycetota bacterium]
AREAVLEQQLSEEQEALNKFYKTMEGRLQSICEEFPPLAIATALEGCLRSSRTGQSVKALFDKEAKGEKLAKVLEKLAQQVIQIYTPDFNQESLDQLQRQSRCESLARDADAVVLQSHDRLGYAPLSMNHLLPLCAKRLLETKFFESRERYKDVLQEERELLKDYESAEEAIPLLDRLNIFQRSEKQAEASDRQKKYKYIQQKRKLRYEESRQQLHESLSAFPPLDLYQRLLETAALTRLLKVEDERTLNSDGTVIRESVERYSALQIIAFNQLMTTFAKTFPELQLPESLRYRTQALDEFPSATQLFFEKVDESAIPDYGSQAIEHAFLQGHIEHQLSDVRDNISLIDRWAFWSDTDAEANEDKLEERKGWNKYWTGAIWEHLINEAETLGQSIESFRLRDFAIHAIDIVEDIHTSQSSSASRINCRVYGREEAFRALSDIRGFLEQDFHLQGNRDDLLGRVYHAIQNSPENTPREQQLRRFRSLSYQDLIAELTRALGHTEFCNLYSTATALTNKLSVLEKEQANADSDVSLWDRINVFTSSEEEDLRDDIKALIEFDNEELHSTLYKMNKLFNRAIRIYPAARLYFELQSVVLAVQRIRATCQSYRSTTGVGKNKRTVTRYRCVIHGRNAANNAMQQWASTFVCQFGYIPGYQQLLETWALTNFKR